MPLLGNLSESEDPYFPFVGEYVYAPISSLLEPENAKYEDHIFPVYLAR